MREAIFNNVFKPFDFYPFGMIMPGRSYTATSSYRFGFNGKEDDNEVEGLGNWQDYGKRMYSPRLGRFPNMDPVFTKFPMLSTYQFASNTPIQCVDVDGKEGVQVVDDATHTTTILVNIYYTPSEDPSQYTSNLSQSQINNIAKDLHKVLDNTNYIDKNHKDPSGNFYGAKFEINFVKTNAVQAAHDFVFLLENQNNIYNPNIFLSYLSTNAKADYGDQGKYEIGGNSDWRLLQVKDRWAGKHDFIHELFHDLISNHLNAPPDIKKDWNDPSIKPGSEKDVARHNKYGGILAEGEAGEKRLSQQNVDDALRTIPEIRNGCEGNTSVPSVTPGTESSNLGNSVSLKSE